MSVLHSNLLTSVQPRAAKGFVMLKEALIMIAAAIAGNWLWKNKIFSDWSIGQQIGLLIFLFVVYIVLNVIFENFETHSSNENDDSDIFFDNAPNPTPSPTNPPTSEQIEFMEFMKQKRQEQEREKELIRRE
jgi:hypothetical protein